MRISIVYHSAAGGTRVVAQLLEELLSADHEVRTAGIHQAAAAGAAENADLLVLCYPTYFLRPSPSMREFCGRLGPSFRGLPVYLVTTYELYSENSLRALALDVREKGMIVRGSAAVRAPGSDLTCVFPDWLCSWLYRFEWRLPDKLRSIAREISALSRRGGRERLPLWKWYTPIAQPLQRGLLDGFIGWRGLIRILPERCTDCGACIARCHRGAWERDGGAIRHRPERCELCTGCIHHCPRNAIVIMRGLRDNKRLNERHYAGLKSRAHKALFGKASL